LLTSGKRQKIAFNEPEEKAVLPEPRSVKKQFLASDWRLLCGSNVTFQVGTSGTAPFNPCSWAFRVISVLRGC